MCVDLTIIPIDSAEISFSLMIPFSKFIFQGLNICSLGLWYFLLSLRIRFVYILKLDNSVDLSVLGQSQLSLSW